MTIIFRKRRRRLPFALILFYNFVVSSCGLLSDAAVTEPVSIRIDEGSLARFDHAPGWLGGNQAISVEFTVTNHSDAAVQLNAGGAQIVNAQLQIHLSDGWQTVGGEETTLPGISPPLTLGSGGSYTRVFVGSGLRDTLDFSLPFRLMVTDFGGTSCTNEAATCVYFSEPFAAPPIGSRPEN